MIDPLASLFEPHHAQAGAILPNAADPAASQMLMILGLAIVVATTLWAVGGLAAAVWTRLSDLRDRRLHYHREPTGDAPHV
jgi:hypothetical protein